MNFNVTVECVEDWGHYDLNFHIGAIFITFGIIILHRFVSLSSIFITGNCFAYFTWVDWGTSSPMFKYIENNLSWKVFWDGCYFIYNVLISLFLFNVDC